MHIHSPPKLSVLSSSSLLTRTGVGSRLLPLRGRLPETLCFLYTSLLRFLFSGPFFFAAFRPLLARSQLIFGSALSILAAFLLPQKQHSSQLPGATVLNPSSAVATVLNFSSALASVLNISSSSAHFHPLPS